MQQAQSNNVSRFIGAFNSIENHFKSRLNANHDKKFRGLLDDYAERFGITRLDHQALRMFADLRNFLAHNEYYMGQPVAQPVPDIVVGIERLRDKILNPPTALSVLPRRPVVRFSPSDPIGQVLDAIRKDDYSQFPIYEGRAYCGLLTTNCITRWLADRLATVGLVEGEAVGDVMRFAESHDKAAHLPRGITAMQAIRRLSPPEVGGPPPAALIVTDSGKPQESPLAIVVADDLALLVNAI